MVKDTRSKTVGKNAKPEGAPPAILLTNPKYPHNLAGIVRAASCFGIAQVWYTGNRIQLDLDKKKRLPREERMKGYRDVILYQNNYPFDMFPEGTVPVAVELQPNAENLIEFEHPENALYVFGPEDGNIGKMDRKHCHRYVVIPTRYCTNLSAAVYLMLYDRMLKRCQAGVDPVRHIQEILNEERSWADKTDAVTELFGADTRGE